MADTVLLRVVESSCSILLSQDKKRESQTVVAPRATMLVLLFALQVQAAGDMFLIFYIQVDAFGNISLMQSQAFSENNSRNIDEKIIWLELGRGWTIRNVMWVYFLHFFFFFPQWSVMRGCDGEQEGHLLFWVLLEGKKKIQNDIRSRYNSSHYFSQKLLLRGLRLSNGFSQSAICKFTIDMVPVVLKFILKYCIMSQCLEIPTVHTV